MFVCLSVCLNYCRIGCNCECLIIASFEFFSVCKLLQSQNGLLLYTHMRKPLRDYIHACANLYVTIYTHAQTFTWLYTHMRKPLRDYIHACANLYVNVLNAKMVKTQLFCYATKTGPTITKIDTRAEITYEHMNNVCYRIFPLALLLIDRYSMAWKRNSFCDLRKVKSFAESALRRLICIWTMFATGSSHWHYCLYVDRYSMAWKRNSFVTYGSWSRSLNLLWEDWYAYEQCLLYNWHRCS